MPYKSVWVDPEICLKHKNIVVYHTYVDDDYEQGQETYYFTTQRKSDGDGFDVRNFDVPSKARLTMLPPFLSDSMNPVFATASEDTKREWAQQWSAWINGGELEVIRTILIEAIDCGLIAAHMD